MKLSARNMLKGTVKAVTPGAINCEVTLDLGNGVEVVAQITSESAKNLGLASGKAAYAVIKADHVMVAVD